MGTVVLLFYRIKASCWVFCDLQSIEARSDVNTIPKGSLLYFYSDAHQNSPQSIKATVFAATATWAAIYYEVSS